MTPTTQTTATDNTATTPLSALLSEFMPELAELGMEPQPTAEAEEEETHDDSQAEEADEAETDEAEETEEDASEEEAEETEDETDEAEEQPKRKEWPDSAKKRVDKLTAKLRAAEAEREQVRADLDRLRDEQTGEKPAESKPAEAESILADVWDESALNQRATDALAWKQWAIENPDGGSVNIKGQSRDFSHDEVRRLSINCDRLLNIEIPTRKDFLRQAIGYENSIRQHLPEYFDTSKPQWKEVNAAISTIPSLKTRPDGMGLAIMLSMGLQQFKAAVEKKGKPAAQTATTKKPPLAPKLVTPAAAHAKPASTHKHKGLDLLLAEGGDIDALQKYFTH